MELLERHFDTAFGAPDGIKKLRELILTLAMQGKLVSQDPHDLPASELLKEIEAEKKRLVKQGKIKEPKVFSPIVPEKVPYALPKGWEWVRLGTVADYNGRDNADPKDIDKDCWVLDLEDIEKSTSRLLYRAKYTERESKSTKSQFEAGDVLYGKLRPYLDKVVVADSYGVCTTELVPIVPSKAIVAHYLRWMLKSPSFLRYVNGLMYGVKMPRLGTDDAINSIHPLPPLNEQLRIVAKIDELMTRCDALEKLRAERDAKRLSVHSAAVRQLLNVADTDGHIQAREFLGLHFGELYTVKENVTELRKAILQLAVMGKLVPQDRNDPPASELLKQIETEKKRLVKECKLKEPKLLPRISKEDVPYALPKGWEWVRFGDVVQILNGRAYKQRELLDKGTPVLRVGNLFTSRHWYYSDLSLGEDKYIDRGDLIYAWSASFGPFIWSGDRAIYHYHIWKIQFFHDNLPNKSFVYNYLLESTVKIKSSGSGIAMIHMTKERMEKLLMPLPPAKEQQRIVVKINQLMGLCDTLEQQIDALREAQSAMLKAMMTQYGSQRCV